MTRTDELHALLVRVKAATRGDRDLEAELFATLGCTTIYRTNYADWYCRWPNDQGEYRLMPAPMSCVDHALALIARLLPDWGGRVSFGSTSTARLWHGERADKIQAQDGASPALALIAALLSALISKEGTHAEHL
ncbi:hypothetical protein DK419_13500 [Methylobacterium terrae]|uniref:Phage ABA sandwich domain-containing protein n=1 Tax=Methylobacterium terrae TaxID=2202827 RepID=A0A2U8WNX3_9HYPH|nr:hypothetical protein [Methylobacterium terrae]AWN47208.1 hypothetical protein DK419_13500 [Methylobacterium terrae]